METHQVVMDKLPKRVKDYLPDKEPLTPPTGYKFQVSYPYIPPGAKEKVLEAIDKTTISSATLIVDELEEKLKQFFGVRFAKACSSGYSALVLALRLAGVREGDEVLIPSFTMIAVLNAVLTIQATPVFVDCAGGGKFNPSVAEYEKKVSEHTRALIVCHTYGVPADCSEIKEFCKSKNIIFIEDIAEAIGAEYNGRLVGTFGDFACASLYANKAITSGDGGFVLSSSPHSTKDDADSYANHGFQKQFHFVHYEHSGNYKMSGLQAAFVLPAVERIPEVMEDRTRIASRYREALKEVDGLELMPCNGGRDTPWMFGVLVDSKAVRSHVRQKLASKGIETRDFFLPLHLQPINVQSVVDYDPEKLPNAEHLGSRGFYLPTFYGMTDEKITDVSNYLKEGLNEALGS